MKENLSNSKINKAKLYKGLSIAGVSLLSASGLIGIALAVTNIVTTKEKNLGTDYGQGLNFNLQFSLNDQAFKDNDLEGMVKKLQDTANALSSKLYKLGLKQIKLVPRIESDTNINNNNLNAENKNIYGVIDINVDSQEGTRWYLNPNIQELFVKLNNATNTQDQKQILDDYVNENYPDEPENIAEDNVINELTTNAANKLAIYFATQSVGKVSLAGNLNQPILNNTNNIEFQNVYKENKNPSFNNPFSVNKSSSQSNNPAFQDVNNSSKNIKLVEENIDSNKKINFEIDIPNLSINNWAPSKSIKANGTNTLNTKTGYLNLSGFVSQFNSVFGWEEHNKNNPDNQWKTYQDAVDAKKAEDEKYKDTLDNPQATWILWTNRSGLITRLNYIGLLAYSSLKVPELNGRLNREYWNNLVGDENKSFSEFNGDKKKDITGQLVRQITDANNEETKYYYWVKEQLINYPNSLKNYLYDFEYSTQNQNEKLQVSRDDKLINNLKDFYKSSIFNQQPNEPSNPDAGTPEEIPPASFYTGTNSKDFDWLKSWNWNSHDLISPYGCVIDYVNFYEYFDIPDLNDVFGKKELKEYNENAQKLDEPQINQYNSAFSNQIKYDTNQKTLADAQNLLDDYGTYNYKNDLINTQIFDAANNISSSNSATNNLQLFGSIAYNYASLTKRSLSNSIINIDPWTSTIIGVSVIVLIIGILISILYRVPGAFATITAFLATILSIIVYRDLNLTFSFDTSIALLAGIFISFITIVNFLSYIPRLLKQKNLNLKFGILKSFKYFVRNSIGIHVTSLIIALVFLYFGQFQIQGFGAMLVINTLMSLLFNVGIFIGFISILTFGLLIYKPSLMFNKQISEYISNIEITGFDDTTNFEQKPWIIKTINSVLFNRIWMWVIASIVALVSILGIILLTTGISQNILINNEYYTILVTGNNQADTIARLNKIGIFINSENYANISSSLLKDPEVSNLLNDGSIQILQGNNYISTMVVKSLVNTCLIAMGFCLIWSLLWLNFVNIINVFVVQLVSLATFGLFGIFPLPIDINVIIIISLGFLINNVMIYSNFINLKFNYQMKASWTLSEIKEYVIKNQKENILLYFIEYLVTIGCLLILMIFISTDTIVANAYIALDCLFNMCIIYVLIPYLFMGMMTAREFYIVKSINHKKQSTVFDYDKVDEQEIVGINKHVYNQI